MIRRIAPMEQFRDSKNIQKKVKNSKERLIKTDSSNINGNYFRTKRKTSNKKYRKQKM